MESITLNFTDKNNNGSKFKIMKGQDPKTNEERYIVACYGKNTEYGNNIKPVPGPEVYRYTETPTGTTVEYLVGSSENYHKRAIPFGTPPFIVVGSNSEVQPATEGEFKDSLLILNEGQEPPFVNVENASSLTITFDGEGKDINFNRTDETIQMSTSIFNKEPFYTETPLTFDQNGRSETGLKIADILELAIRTTNYSETSKMVAEAFGSWNRNGGRKR